MGKCILDLCGGSGAWSKPYREAGYFTQVVDPRSPDLPDGQSYRGTVQEFLDELTSEARGAGAFPHFHGVLIAPPCTEFAGSGARWWASKPKRLLEEAVAVVRACLKIKDLVDPNWWVLENPVGRLNRCLPELGQPILYFNPSDYGDPYTKRTGLWGKFNEPKKRPVEITHKRGSSPIHRMAPGPERAAKRSLTPPGFAKAFMEANP